MNGDDFFEQLVMAPEDSLFPNGTVTGTRSGTGTLKTVCPGEWLDSS